MTTVEGIAYLTRCALNGFIPNKELIASLDLDAVFTIAQKHMIAAIVGMALDGLGIEDKNFKHAIAAAQRKTVVLNHEKQLVFDALDKAGIWHMALKGSVLRDLYPRFGMRESADVDILFDKEFEEQVRDIMIGLGFTVKAYGNGHSDNYYKAPLSNFEMHPNLFGPHHRTIDNQYYSNVKARLVQIGDYEYVFSPDDFYVFQLAHEYKHYSSGGTGLRSVIDTYVMLQTLSLNWDYIAAETDRLGIREFEEKNRALATHLFGEDDITEEDKEILHYMVDSGSFGTIQNLVNNIVDNNGGGLGGRFRYIFTRLILSMDVVKASFPTFYKHKILLPFLPLYRLLRGNTGNRKRLRAELNALMQPKDNGKHSV